MVNFSINGEVIANAGQAALGGFNAAGAALTSALTLISSLSNYLIGFFLLIFLTILVLAIKNIAVRPSFDHIRLAPALAWKKPADTYKKWAYAGAEGDWVASYARHRLYHQIGATSFWGALTSATVKLSLLFLFSLAIIPGGALSAPEESRLINYQIVFDNPSDQAVKLAIVNPLP